MSWGRELVRRLFRRPDPQPRGHGYRSEPPRTRADAEQEIVMFIASLTQQVECLRAQLEQRQLQPTVPIRQHDILLVAAYLDAHGRMGQPGPSLNTLELRELARSLRALAEWIPDV